MLRCFRRLEGKPLVALWQCEAVEAGAQTAMLAPTEILARSSCDTPAQCEAIGVTVAILTGREGQGARSILMGLATDQSNRSAHRIVSACRIAKLGLSVDDQHRSVSQRLLLSEKASDRRIGWR